MCMDGLLSVNSTGGYGLVSIEATLYPSPCLGAPYRLQHILNGITWVVHGCFWVACVPGWVSVQLRLLPGFVPRFFGCGCGWCAYGGVLGHLFVPFILCHHCKIVTHKQMVRWIGGIFTAVWS